MVVLITGGAGFIASHTVDLLLEEGYDVRIVDDLSAGKLVNLPKTVEFINCSIINFEEDMLKDIESVIHLAAVPSVQFSFKNPFLVNDVNIKGTLNMLDKCAKKEVDSFVFASSSSVYGSNPTLPKVESLIPAPLSPYAVTKLVGEIYCSMFSTVYGLNTVCLRYFNVFGPRQNPLSEYSAAIPKFITAILKNDSPVIFGDGTQTRDFTFVRNVARANILAMQSNLKNEVINIGTGGSISLLKVITKINTLTNKNIQPIFSDFRKGDVKHSLADINKARRLINYSPDYSFDDGLRITIDWYRTL